MFYRKRTINSPELVNQKEDYEEEEEKPIDKVTNELDLIEINGWFDFLWLFILNAITFILLFFISGIITSVFFYMIIKMHLSSDELLKFGRLFNQNKMQQWEEAAKKTLQIYANFGSGRTAFQTSMEYYSKGQQKYISNEYNQHQAEKFREYKKTMFQDYQNDPSKKDLNNCVKKYIFYSNAYKHNDITPEGIKAARDQLKLGIPAKKKQLFIIIIFLYPLFVLLYCSLYFFLKSAFRIGFSKTCHYFTWRDILSFSKVFRHTSWFKKLLYIIVFMLTFALFIVCDFCYSYNGYEIVIKRYDNGELIGCDNPIKKPANNYVEEFKCHYNDKNGNWKYVDINDEICFEYIKDLYLKLDR